MKIQVEAVSPVEKKVTVEIDAAQVAKEVDRAYVGLGRRVRLPGFRPGKVPRNVLVRNFRGEVEREVVEKLVNDSFAEAVRSEKIEAVASPSVSLDDPKFDVEKPLKYTAKVEVRPQISPRDYRGLEVTHKPAAVTDAMVEEELQKLRESAATLVPVEGRDVAEKGDWATIDHEGTVEGKPFAGAAAQGVTVRVQEGALEEGNFGQLEGKKIGETVEFDHAFAADYRLPEVAGKTARFKVVVQGLKVRKAPVLDDEFAKMVGILGVETAEQLRARVRADLEKREKAKADSELKDALVKAALAKNEFEVPPALVERTIDAMLESTAERLARSGIDLRHLQLDVPQLRADLREKALGQVRGALLLEAIAVAEKIEVGEEDVEKEIARIAEEHGVPLERAKKDFRGKEPLAALHVRILEEKALAVLSSSATIKNA
ncbi:MAG TPA: trigger factor [Anaeromyxobacteraceae bacterium]|nr:trigger factor [Anaeromyxobacteraceae bacterium]